MDFRSLNGLCKRNAEKHIMITQLCTSCNDYKPLVEEDDYESGN